LQGSRTSSTATLRASGTPPHTCMPKSLPGRCVLRPPLEHRHPGG
jgi:hypothetical protein